MEGATKLVEFGIEQWKVLTWYWNSELDWSNGRCLWHVTVGQPEADVDSNFNSDRQNKSGGKLNLSQCAVFPIFLQG
jgi:hypothetical protein